MAPGIAERSSAIQKADEEIRFLSLAQPKSNASKKSDERSSCSCTSLDEKCGSVSLNLPVKAWGEKRRLDTSESRTASVSPHTRTAPQHGYTQGGNTTGSPTPQPTSPQPTITTASHQATIHIYCHNHHPPHAGCGGGRDGARHLGLPAPVLPHRARLLCGAGQHLAVPLPLPAERRRYRVHPDSGRNAVN